MISFLFIYFESFIIKGHLIHWIFHCRKWHWPCLSIFGLALFLLFSFLPRSSWHIKILLSLGSSRIPELLRMGTISFALSGLWWFTFIARLSDWVRFIAQWSVWSSGMKFHGPMNHLRWLVHFAVYFLFYICISLPNIQYIVKTDSKNQVIGWCIIK